MHHLSSAASRAALILALGTCVASPSPAQAQSTAPISQQLSTTVSPTGVALIEGVKSGQAAAVLSALEAGANVNVRDDEGKTPLMWAAGWGRADLLKVLLDRGADVGARDNLGRTALHYVLAARPATPTAAPVAPPKKKRGQGGLLGKIKSAGASIAGGLLSGDAADVVRGTLGGDLAGVANGFKSRLVSGLLNNGVGESLLGRHLSSLLEGNGFNPGDRKAWGAVIGSAILGDSDNGLSEILSGDFANMDAVGWTRLLAATSKNNPSVLEAVSKLAPSLESAQNKDWTRFIKAAGGGDVAGVREVLQNKSIAPLLQRALPALQEAANELPGHDGGVSIVRALLDKGADASLADASGTTALQWAQKRGLAPVVALLQAPQSSSPHKKEAAPVQ